MFIFVQFIATSTTQSIGTCLRFIEIYTSAKTYSKSSIILCKIYKFLVVRKYFAMVRTIVESRIPPVLEETVRAPTPLAEEILRMLDSPLGLAYETQVDTSMLILGFALSLLFMV